MDLFNKRKYETFYLFFIFSIKEDFSLKFKKRKCRPKEIQKKGYEIEPSVSEPFTNIINFPISLIKNVVWNIFNDNSPDFVLIGHEDEVLSII